MGSEDRKPRRFVATEMSYLGDPHKTDDGQRLHYYADFSGTTNARLAPWPVEVEDARPYADQFTLDRQGFEIARCPTVIEDFADTEAIAPRYLAECEALIRTVTGADITFPAGSPHCRFDGVSDPRARYDGKPARYVHADYSDAAVAPSLTHLPIKLSNYPRYAIYNIWRVVTPPPQSIPLAVCDARTIKTEDEFESLVILNPPDGIKVETFTVLYRPNTNHRWYYFSDMTPDEVLIFKSFDSDPSRVNRVAHCAFVDGTKAPGAARVSIEARVAAAWTPRYR